MIEIKDGGWHRIAITRGMVLGAVLASAMACASCVHASAPRTINAAKSDDRRITASSPRAMAQTARAISEDVGCPDGKMRRSSSLCADWQSADAAHEASTWAARSFWASLVGTALLIWTLWETRSNARREMRAYVSVKILGMEIMQDRSGAATFALRIMAHNGGATPAYDCTHFGFISPMTPAQAQQMLNKIMPIDKDAQSGGSVIHSNEDFPVLMRNRITLPPSALAELNSGALTLYAFGVASYRDVFGHRRRTDFCHYLPPDSFAASFEAVNAKPGEELPVEWIVAPFHNTAS